MKLFVLAFAGVQVVKSIEVTSTNTPVSNSWCSPTGGMEGVAFEIQKTEGAGVDQRTKSGKSVLDWTTNEGTYPAPYPHCRNLCMKKSAASHMQENTFHTVAIKKERSN